MKKVIALVLSLVMVLGLLAGCGNKQSDSDKKKDEKDCIGVYCGYYGYCCTGADLCRWNFGFQFC